MESSLTLTLIFAIIIPFLFYYLVIVIRPKNKAAPSKSSSSSTLRSPPQAGGSKPLIGHLQMLSGTAHADLPHFKLAALADEHGPIFTIRLGVNSVLVVSSRQLIKELCTDHDVAISNRPKLRAFKHLSYDFSMFGSAPYGPYWREVRKLISMKLLSSRRLEIMSHVIMSEIDGSIADLYGKWSSKGRQQQHQHALVVDMKQWFGDMDLNIILRMMVGIKTRAYEEGAERRRRAMRDWFHYTGVFVPGDALPYLAWMDIGGLERKMKKVASELDEIMTEWLEEHKARSARREKKKKDDQYQDFMDVLLEELARGSLQADGYDHDTVIKATCILLIAGATDTTAVMLEWGLSLLLNNPDVMKRVQEELDDVIGKERRANESDVSKLTYLQAVVKETFRLYPAGPLGGLREFTKDVVVGSYYHIPKGTWLIMNVWKVQRDPSVWGPDVDEFRPERFLEGPRKDLNVVLGQDFELIPFGAGRRICPGSNFGVQMLHLVFASVLHAFDFKTATGERVDMTESAGMTNSKATPLQVLVSPRLSPHLYAN